jgi:peptidyl-tRNA hydrolase, PTH1 family
MKLFGRRGAAARRRGTPADLLVVGLGNPGADYAGTRHNVGSEVIGLLADRRGTRLRHGRERAQAAELRIGEQRVVLATPLTFMNLSGEAVASLVKRYGITDPTRLVIVHDELDLDVGRVKVKRGGGLAGHKGLGSIKSHLGTAEFLRVRIGVGRPPGRQSGADHVLRRPGRAERTELDVAVARAADAVEMIVSEGVDAAMTHFNA